MHFSSFIECEFFVKNNISLADFPGEASDFSFPLAKWERDQTSLVQTKVIKEQTNSYPGQAKFESYMYLSKASLFRALYS